MIINLREWYPDYYKADVYIDVPDEIVAAMKEYDRQDAAYQRRTYYNKAHYSLDRGDGIENAVLFPPQTPEEICERRTRIELLYQAIASLPIKQAGRIYAHFILGLSQAEIARKEGISAVAVHYSIQLGMRQIKKRFERENMT